MKIFINVSSFESHKERITKLYVRINERQKKHKETEFTILNEFWISFDNSRYLYIKIQYNLLYNNKVVINFSELLRSNYFFLIYIIADKNFRK